MNIELKKNWLAALRSGEYKQTTDYLRRDEGYCCLGVLCDISGLGKWECTDKTDGIYRFICDGEKASVWYSTLPQLLQDVTGINLDVVSQAVKLNDNNKPFTEIADYLEANA